MKEKPVRVDPQKFPDSRPTDPSKQEQQPMLSDFGLYKCQACGKMVIGYEKEQHVKEVHKGKDVGYEKLR